MLEATLTGPNGPVQLGSNTVTIGRSGDNQIVVNDPQASSHHAEIRPDPQGHALIDLNSTNGTYVNDARIAPNMSRPLNNRDVIRIGAAQFTYEQAGSYEPTLRASTNEYANPDGYAPTVAAQQPGTPSAPNYNNPGYQPTQAAPSPDYGTPGYPNYQQPSYPGYEAQQQSPYPNYQQPSAPNYGMPQGTTSPNYGAPPNYQQPSYPAQPGWSGPPPIPVPGQVGAPPAQQKKSRTGLIIALIVIVLIIAGGIGGYLYINRSTPQKTLQAFCTAFQNNDSHAAYVTLSSRVQQQTSEQRFAQGFDQLEQAFNAPQAGGLRSCDVSNVQENGSSATGVVTMSVNKLSTTLVYDATLVNENGNWKIDKLTLRQ